jgi:protein TonB
MSNLREGEAIMHIRAFVVVLPMLIFVLSGCSAPPTAEAEAARQSLATASSAGAEKYAPASLKEAQAAQAALDAELKAQEANYVKSYDRARGLAAAAKTAADKAAADAGSARERAAAEDARKAKAAAARREKLAKAVRVGGEIRPPVRVMDVAPVYPAIAKSARVQGDVVIEATIDEEGKVAEARVVKSVPLLDQAALDAVRQWQYRPSLLNGIPTPVVMTVTVKFTQSEVAARDARVDGR